MSEEVVNIIESAEDYVLQLLGEKLNSKMVYHGPAHTCEVVEAAKFLGHKAELNDKDMEILQLAAWFHDVGFVVGYDNHEENGLKIARKFLEDNNYPESDIQTVLNAINTTKLDVAPSNLIEEIMCDADLYHISTSDCLEKAGFLRQEWELFLGEVYTDEQWYTNTIEFYQSHHYHTPYAREVLQRGKEMNIKNLEELRDSL